MASSNYWDTAGRDWMDDLDEITRIKMWTALFEEQAGLRQEDAESLAESIVSYCGQSESDTQAIDAVLGCLTQAGGSQREIGMALDTFLSVVSDTFYAKHAMAVPKLGIKPKDRPSFNSMLKQYLTMTWYLGALWSKVQSSGDRNR